MRSVLQQLSNYFKEADKRILLASALFTGLLVFINYYYGLNEWIISLPVSIQYICWYIVFLIAFSFSYLLLIPFAGKNLFRNKTFVALFVMAPILFAWKMAAPIDVHFSDQAAVNNYWNRVIYFPAKLLVIAAGLFLIWMLFDKDQPYYGTDLRQFHPKPYFIMLLIMVPLIAAASTQPDFLSMYPKLKGIRSFLNAHPSPLYAFLYELSYGIDFVGIELFFRGFLILAFVKWAGKDAILPMACFYCTIHFGKPLGECISSFFGGMILGVVTYHTRTILGGLMVHLGIAWLMEIGGYFGNLFFK
jgi:hypothetical protein